MKKTIVMCALAAMLLTTAGAASAAGYSQGTISITPSVSGYALLNNNTTSLFTYGVDLGYFVVDGLELGLRGQGVYLTTQFTSPLIGGTNYEHFNGLGAEGFARWHFYQFDNNAGSFFAEIGAGALWFTETVTNWNSGAQFSGIAGLGVSYNLSQYCSVVASANYRHVGAFDSTGIDGLGGTIGLKFSF